MLVWDEGGKFETTGHVAIVAEVTPTYMRVAEQNVGHCVWPDEQSYSRPIKARTTTDANYWLECSFRDARNRGWVVQTDDDSYAEHIEPPDRRLLNLQTRELTPRAGDSDSWLNIANPDEAAYVDIMERHRLHSGRTDQHNYYCIPESALSELRRATKEPHALYARDELRS